MPRRYICPKCKERRGVDILYGMPTHEAAEMELRGELALGGCCIDLDGPERRCTACGHEWRIKRRLWDGLHDGPLATLMTDAAPAPALLEWRIGGYPSGEATIAWRDGRLEVSSRGFGSPVEVLPEPNPSQWARLLATLDEQRVWTWSADYFDPDVLDGTQWSLRIHWPGRRRKRCTGSNSYPDGFDRVRAALGELVRVPPSESR